MKHNEPLTIFSVCFGPRYQQGWREVIEAVFSEEAVRRRQVVRFNEGAGEDDKERKVRRSRRRLSGVHA